MIATWLREHVTAANLSMAALRLELALLVLLDGRAERRAEIACEIHRRRWAQAVERTLGDRVCVWTTRGGKS